MPAAATVRPADTASPPRSYGSFVIATSQPATEPDTVSGERATAPGHLPLTGERTVPDLESENYWFRRHEVAYRAVLPWLTGADVLEAGAGEGYGTSLIGGVARTVIALDYDQSAASHLRRRYRLPTIRGNVVQVPVATGSVDAVISLQTIEHLWDQPGFVAECARVLRPAGTLIVSTPNRLTFSPGLDKPVNPFHTRELSAAEFAELLAPRFRLSRMYGVFPAARLRRTDRTFGKFGGFVNAQLASESSRWNPRLRRAVRRVTVDDFTVRQSEVTDDGFDSRIDASLDLLAIATRLP